jgi:hypothetical protein
MKTFLSILMVGFFASSAHSQTGNVGIGTNAPATSAVLDVQSTSRGLLLPRLSSTQMHGITSPVEGLLVYNTNTGNFWGYHRYDTVAAQNTIDLTGSFSAYLNTSTPATWQTLQTTHSGTLRYVVLKLANFSTTATYTLTVDLLSGAGTGGSTLATTTLTVPPFYSGNVADLDTVNFSGNVTLAANAVHTLRVTCFNCGAANSGQTNSVAVIGEGTDVYPGGTWLGPQSSLQSPPDMYFYLGVSRRGWRSLQFD